MPSTQPVRAVILVSGRVQGVGYRAFAEREACQLALVGGVRNCEDGRVEADVEGERSMVEAFIERLRAGPRLARVEHLHVEWTSPTGRHRGFQVWY